MLAGHGQSEVEVENTLDVYLIWPSLQIVFHDSLVLGVLVAAGWGFFSALVAMTCTRDASAPWDVQQAIFTQFFSLLQIVEHSITIILVSPKNIHTAVIDINIIVTF